MLPCTRQVYYYIFKERVFDFLDPSCDWALEGAKNNESASEAMIVWCIEKKIENKKKRKKI